MNIFKLIKMNTYHINVQSMLCKREWKAVFSPEVWLDTRKQILHLHSLCQHLLPREAQVVHSFSLFLAET